jgi:hypothetical protein
MCATILTDGLNGGNDQVARDDLSDLCRPSGPTSKSLLQFANEDVTKRCRNKKSVQCHLYSTCVHLGACEGMNEEWCIFGGLWDGGVGQVGTEHLLKEAKCPFREGVRTGNKKLKRE